MRLSPPLRRFHQLPLCVLSFICVLGAPVIAVSAILTYMTPEEMLARLLYRDGLMLVIDKPAGFAVHRGPKGGESLEDYFDALRFGLPRDAGAGAPARQRHLRLPGARPPPQGAGAARQAVQAGQDRQDLLGGGRGRRREAEEGRIDIPLGKLDETRGWWMKPDPHGLPAATTWKVMGRGGGLTWLALEPLTGRTHQLARPLRRDGLADRGRQHLRPRAAHRRAAAAPAFARDRGADFQEQAAGQVTAPVPAHMREALRASAGGSDETNKAAP